MWNFCPELDSLRWGDVPTWVAALGTVAALFIALRTLKGEIAARRAAEESRKDDEADRDAQQARLIRAHARDAMLLGLVITVRNHSEAPVFGLSLVGLRTTPWEPDLYYAHGITGECDVLEPKETVEWTVGTYRPGTFRGLSADEIDHASPVIEFIDASGMVWRSDAPLAPVRVKHRERAAHPEHAAPIRGVSALPGGR